MTDNTYHTRYNNKVDKLLSKDCGCIRDTLKYLLVSDITEHGVHYTVEQFFILLLQHINKLNDRIKVLEIKNLEKALESPKYNQVNINPLIMKDNVPIRGIISE